MPNYNDHLQQAAEYWREGKALDAGRLLFESLPNDARPKWAVGILRLVLERSGVQSPHFEQLLARSGIQSPLFQQLLYTADHQPLWGNGHRVFSLLREVYLELLERQKRRGLKKEEVLLTGVVSLAELVAKVTYNAVNPPDEFDEDSGWCIAASLKGFVDNVWHDEEFAKAAWSALSSNEG